jgi:hypothetical protein
MQPLEDSSFAKALVRSSRYLDGERILPPERNLPRSRLLSE